MSLLLRLILIPCGYVVAMFAAVFLITAVELGRAYGPVAGDGALIGMTIAVVVTDAFVLLWILGAAAFLPTIAAAIIAEFLSIRSWLYFALAGAAVAGVVSRLVPASTYPGLPQEPATIVAAGLIGGLAYWLVAGRSSGVNKSVPA